MMAAEFQPLQFVGAVILVPPVRAREGLRTLLAHTGFRVFYPYEQRGIGWAPSSHACVIGRFFWFAQLS